MLKTGFLLSLIVVASLKIEIAKTHFPALIKKGCFMKKLIAVIIILAFGIATSFAAEIVVTINSTEKSDKTVGQITFTDSQHGLLITPKLNNLPPGPHGFHLHEHPDCADHGKAAGSHFDPQGTGTHLGPYGKGHLGDLPVLYVNEDGSTTIPSLAPRLKVSELNNLSVMIHEGSDTYSDTPELGGGGARIACGVIKFDNDLKSQITPDPTQ
jgi:Cu-Zn family superoxide dismutase